MGLILSHRHTEKDLFILKDYEEIDRISICPKKKIDYAKNIIKIFIDKHPESTIYTSWGKDSVVLLYLCSELKLKNNVVYVRLYDRDNPDCDNVKKIFLDRYDINYNEEFFNYDEVKNNDGHWKYCSKKYGSSRITGIRSDESNKRLLIWKKYGFYTELTCRPLSLFTNQDIFSFIYHNDLPLCAVYGYTGGGRWDRQYIRTHSIGGSTADGIGRTEWEKEYYQDILNRIKFKNYYKKKDL